MTQTIARAEHVRALVNDIGQSNWPLTHSNALEIISKLHGAKDWNTLAARGGNNSEFKDQAKVLKRSLAAKNVRPPIDAETAKTIDQALFAPRAAMTLNRAKPTMDDLLSYLDLEKVRIGSRLVGQEGDWLTSEAELITAAAMRTMQRTVEEIERYMTGDLPTEMKEKAGVLMNDLGRTVLPKPKKNAFLAEVEGLWHESIEGRERGTKIGMADYVMNVKPHRLRLVFDNPYKPNTAPYEPWDRPKSNKLFTKWLSEVPADFFAPSAPRWAWTVTSKRSEKAAFFCFTSIPDISRVVRKLRRFTDEMKEGSVLVCSPDAQALEIIARQKIGTVRYASGEITSISIRDTLRPQTSESHSYHGLWRPWDTGTFPSHDNPDMF